MNSEQKVLLSERIETGLLFLWGVVLFLFPIFYSTFTTSEFALPKTLLVAVAVLLSLLGMGAQILLHGQVRIKRTPLDVPIILFLLAIILSSIFSANKADSLVSAVTALFAGFTYFVLVNAFRTRKVTLFLTSSILTGGIVATLITVAAHYKLYLLPFASSKVTGFTPLGSPLEFVLFALILLPLTIPFLLPALKQQFSARVGVFAVAFLVLVAGIIVAGSIVLTTPQALLPFDTGFQTAFAAISQDSGRILQTFLFGEGYGNFATVYNRFHNASINSNATLWYISFNNSSSYILELLATTGLVGVLSYLFLIFKILTPFAAKKKNPFYISLVVVFVLSILLPFSSTEITLLFFLLAGMTLAQRETAPHEYFDIELKFVALKKGVVAFTTLDVAQQGKTDAHPTPIAAFVVLLALVVGLGYYTTIYVLSDMQFQQSLVAANGNNGTVTYRLQAQAITTYPYRSDYYRIFSQTNIALANSLLSLSAGASPSATTQQTAYTLIQQAITTGRQATILAPQSAIAWQNLSSVYRSLIGVGQNAQDFAIQAAQQATVLDSNDPQEYLNLGGLYYQTAQYDSAIRMFQQAISLKNDYANAYYNLGHSYEQKNDFQDALSSYQIVKQLVANDKTNSAAIDSEIQRVQHEMASGTTANTNTTPTQNGQQQQQLALPQNNQLPKQSTQVPLITPTAVPSSRK